MLNVTVIGTVRDDSGHLQSGNYTVEYKDRDVLVGPIATENSQINFNVGDNTHLGCNGTMRYGEVMYVEFTNNAGNKNARCIHQYAGENVIKLDATCKESWNLVSSLIIEEQEDGVYRLNSVCTGDTNIFRIYICGKSIFETNPSDCDWKLVKTINSTTDFIDVAFAKSIRAKIEVETTKDGHTSNLETTVIDTVISMNQLDIVNMPYFIEWE